MNAKHEQPGAAVRARREPLLTDLAQNVLANWQSPEMERRRRLWQNHFRFRKQAKIPVKCAVFEAYDLVWQQLIPEDTLVFKDGPRRQAEIQLRIKLEKFRRFPDDDVIAPALRTQVDRRRDPAALWGLPLAVESSGAVGGATRPIPPIHEESDLERLRIPAPIPLPDEERRAADELRELTGGILPVQVHTDELHYGPYEWAVRLRGAEQLLFDFYDRPEWVRRLLDRITAGMAAYHRARESADMIEAETLLPRIHVPYDPAPAGLERKLAGAWCYAHAQSAATLGPEMYAEFVQPCNARIAGLFHKVYYHGCEDLGRKAEIIRDLPHLAYFHVSPWTQLADVVPVLRGRPLALEVHAHPAQVLFSYTPEQMRAELRRRIAAAEDMVFDLKICDIQTIQGAEGKLEQWVAVAMEESIRQ